MSEVDERQKQAAPQPQRPKKSLNDLFSKYSPDPESRLLFDCASGYTVARSNINPGLYEVTVSLPRLFDTKIFSRIENGIKSAYGGKYAVRLVPSYGASLFSPDSLDLLISDAHARMLLPAGFFDKYNIVENDSDDYTVEIPFGTGGIDFLAKRNAESKIEELVKREFSTEIRVTIAEMAVQTVGIADRYGTDQRVAVEYGAATVAYTVTSLHMTQLQDSGLQGGYCT